MKNCDENFDRFVNSNINIFLKYNRKYKLPKCVKNKSKKCKCFNTKKKIINFNYECPMQYIQDRKKEVKNKIALFDTHNNMLVIELSANANFTCRDLVQKMCKNHIKTLKKFASFIFFEGKQLSEKKRNLYKTYIEFQKSKCDLYLSETILYEKIIIPFIVLNVTLYSHYHTLKLFEKFVSDIKK